MKFITTTTLLAALGIGEVSTVLAGVSDIDTGSYLGVDTEDGSQQNLEILCSYGLCDITLSDGAFSTCIKSTGKFYGGVGFVKGVPKDSLDDFKIDLFCLQPGQLELDIDNDSPTTTLTGDMTSSPGGVIHRTGPEFVYFKTSNFSSSSHTDSVSNEEFANGRYSGTDTEDGSFQNLDVFCSKGHCNITLADFSFSTCAMVTGNSIFGGVGFAKQIPEDVLDNFKIKLFCLFPGQLEIDIDNDTPTTTLTGNMILLQDGVIHRTGPGFNYYRVSISDEEPYHSMKSLRSMSSDESDSISTGINFNGRYAGTDTEDGSVQFLNILCSYKLCNITLADYPFSTCAMVTGNPLFGGVGVASSIPEDSLDDFKIDLFCLQPGQLEMDIDNDSPASTLTGDMILLQDGIIRRTGPGFMYSKGYTGNVLPRNGNETKPKISNGLYAGTDTEDGGFQTLQVLCSDGLCDIILADASFSTCAIATGSLLFGGVGVAKNIPEDSLDAFDINLFCAQPGQLEMDIDNDTPTTTLTGNMTASDFDGIIRRTGPGFIYFKFTTE